MPKINKLNIYPLDNEVTLDDYLLGTDRINVRKTKNYAVGSLIDLIQESQGISTLTFIYSIEDDYNQPGFFFTEDDITDFGQVSTLYFNKINASGINVSALLNVLVHSPNHLALKIAKPNDPNIFSFYRITSYTEYANYYELNVEILNNAYYGQLNDQDHFSIAVDVVSVENFNEDKHYLHDQATPSSTWNCTHNLGKKPSVTVLDSSGNEVEGEVIYTSINQTVIKFSAPFSGEATFN